MAAWRWRRSSRSGLRRRRPSSCSISAVTGTRPSPTCLACSISRSTRSRRRILGLFGGIVDVGRSFAAAPGTPPDRVAALRTAFMAMVSDPVFVTDMGKRNLGIEPLPGAEVQKIIAAAVATPVELAQQAGRYLGP